LGDDWDTILLIWDFQSVDEVEVISKLDLVKVVGSGLIKPSLYPSALKSLAGGK
jgi:hypothetical protein